MNYSDLKIFYGASIQGGRQKSNFNGEIIDYLKNIGINLISEHVRGENRMEVRALLAQSLNVDEKSLTPELIRNKAIEWCESDINAAIFEVSVPSLGTGIEIAHCYLRPRLGLREIPILCLYEKDFWSNRLSTMLTGANSEKDILLNIVEYKSINEVKEIILEFINKNCG